MISAVVLDTAWNTLWLDVSAEIVPKFCFFHLDAFLFWLYIVDHKVYFRFRAQYCIDRLLFLFFVFYMRSLLYLVLVAVNSRLVSFNWWENLQEPPLLLLELEIFLLFVIVINPLQWVDQGLLALYAHIWVMEHIFVDHIDTQLKYVWMGHRYDPASVTVTTTHSLHDFSGNTRWQYVFFLFFQIHF